MGASMTQHTPGPWTAEDIPGQPRHMFRIADAENCLICESESTRPDGWANARLIAKAPEMYLDLVMLCEHIESWRLVIDGPEYASIREDMRREIATVRALLRAIEGQ